MNMVINNVNAEAFESTLIPEKTNKHETTMLIDSESAASIIDYDFFKEIRAKENKIESSLVKLLGNNSTQLEVVGGKNYAN